MIINGREVKLRESFIESLIVFENYLGKDNPVIGRLFTNKIFNYCFDILSVFPYSAPKFIHEGFSIFDLRKATFQKKYIILYLVLENSIEFIEIYHASKNPKNLNL